MSTVEYTDRVHGVENAETTPRDAVEGQQQRQMFGPGVAAVAHLEVNADYAPRTMSEKKEELTKNLRSQPGDEHAIGCNAKDQQSTVRAAQRQTGTAAHEMSKSQHAKTFRHHGALGAATSARQEICLQSVLRVRGGSVVRGNVFIRVCHFGSRRKLNARRERNRFGRRRRGCRGRR